MDTIKFKTEINCPNCLRIVTPFLNKLEYIKKWNVDTENPDKILTVEGENLDVNDIISTVKSAGFKIEKL